MARVLRYRVLVKPRAASDYKRGRQWNNKLNKYVPVMVTNWSPVYTSGRTWALSPGPHLHRIMTEKELKATQQWAGKKQWMTRARKVYVNYDPYPWLKGDVNCKPALLKALNAVGADLKKKILIRSGNRTYAEQAYLYNLYLNHRGNLAARPGTSNHEGGKAADCGVNGVHIGNYPGARASMKRHGVCLPVGREPWHTELGNTWRA